MRALVFRAVGEWTVLTAELNKLLKKSAEIFTSEKIKDYKLQEWIGEYVRSQGYKINAKAISLLDEHIGNDLNRIVNEIEKLALNLKGKKDITEDDIPIYEVFGQSECSGPHTINYLTGWKIGTCGRPLPGTESKIDELTGEICYRGRHIFMGYMKMVDKTRETIDDEGKYKNI